MRTDRAVDVVVRLGDGEELRQALDARRDRHHRADARRPRARQEPGAVLGELREVEVAVMVHEHHDLGFFSALLRLPLGAFWAAFGLSLDVGAAAPSPPRLSGST